MPNHHSFKLFNLMITCLLVTACAAVPETKETPAAPILPYPQINLAPGATPNPSPVTQNGSQVENVEADAPASETSSSFNGTAPDKDLTHLLTDNNFGLQGASIHLTPDRRLLMVADSAALFDLESETLLLRTDSIGNPSFYEAMAYGENVTGVFKKQMFGCEDDCMLVAPLLLDRYDSNLKLIDTTNLTEAFALPEHLMEPFWCALSKSGDKVVCPDLINAKVLLYDLQTKARKVVFDYLNGSLPTTFGYFDSFTFAGNDRYLAFTATEESGFGFGLINLEEGQLAGYRRWDPIAEDIQTTDQLIYFHEMFKSLAIPRTGTIFKVDLDTLKIEDIQLADEEESKGVIISHNGQYLVTIWSSPLGTPEAYRIRVYEAETMALIRKIDMGSHGPGVEIDEANRCLIVRYYLDGMMRLGRYDF